MNRDFQSSAITRSQMIPDVPIKKLDDSHLIQEISKNYILIPKLRSPSTNNYIQQAPPIHNADTLQDKIDIQHLSNVETPSVRPNTNDNTDWKSKYEILNILKKEETESQAIELHEEINIPLKVTSESLSKNDIPLSNIYEKAVAPEDNTVANMHTNAGYKYLDELPEKDMPVEKVNYEGKICDGSNDNVIAHAAESGLHADIKKSTEIFDDGVGAIENIDHQLQNTHLECNYSEVSNAIPAEENVNYTGHEDYIYSEPINPNVPHEQINYEEHFEPINDVNPMMTPADHNVEITENVYVADDFNLPYESDVQPQLKCEDPQKAEYVDEQDAKPIQVISSNDLMNEINNSADAPESEPTEYVEQVAENVNMQELSPNVDLQMKSIADRSSEKLEIEQTNVDVAQPEEAPEPQAQTTAEITEMPVKEEQMPDAAGLEAYEAEQQGLFYSEHLNANYDYQQGDANVYDQAQQQGIAGVYPHNDNYPYYDNMQQPHPVDIGENEEQISRYDQSFPQQYVDPYESAYEKKPQQPEPFEPSQLYEESQPEALEQHDQQNYETEVYQSQEQVESQLDTEDGYNEQKKDVNPQQVEKPEPEKK